MKNVKKKKQVDLIHRWEGNPIITIDDIPFSCSDICNAAAVKFNDEYILLITIENMEGKKSIYLAKSKDGYRFNVDSKPFISISLETPFFTYENHGVFDPKISLIEEVYYITYTAASSHGFRLSLAETRDFKNVKKIGFISEPDSKGGLLFSEKIKGKYAKLEMPMDGGRIWISYSEDLIYWGEYDEIMSPRGGYWDFHKIGPAVPPFRLEDGKWLLLYYGVKNTSAGTLSRIGAAFLDSDNPAKVVLRTNIPIISPREMYERIGDIPNTVFSCGAILEGDKLLLYYGGSQSCICIGTTTVSKIMDNCIASEREF